MAFDLIAELEGLVDIFEREQVEYAVCGGIALALHGFVRATMDIDVLVAGPQLDAALAIAHARGFDTALARRLSEPGAVERLHVSKVADTGEKLGLDLFVVTPDLEDIWKTRIAVEHVPGKRMTIVSRVGLTAMKRRKGRPQDLVDISRLEDPDDDANTWPIDMSPRAVAIRHGSIGQLYKLMLYLRGARIIGPVDSKRASKR